jgi:hypothetical protein
MGSVGPAWMKRSMLSSSGSSGSSTMIADYFDGK